MPGNPHITANGPDFRVGLNEDFTVFGSPTLSTSMTFVVGGAKIKINTNCRKPLGWGDKFGVLVVVGFTNTHGDNCYAPPTTTYYRVASDDAADDDDTVDDDDDYASVAGAQAAGADDDEVATPSSSGTSSTAIALLSVFSVLLVATVGAVVYRVNKQQRDQARDRTIIVSQSASAMSAI